MQEALVYITLVAAFVYLGKKAYEWFRPKSTSCEGCSFGQASQKEVK